MYIRGHSLRVDLPNNACSLSTIFGVVFCGVVLNLRLYIRRNKLIQKGGLLHLTYIRTCTGIKPCYKWLSITLLHPRPSSSDADGYVGVAYKNQAYHLRICWRGLSWTRNNLFWSHKLRSQPPHTIIEGDPSNINTALHTTVHTWTLLLNVFF